MVCFWISVRPKCSFIFWHLGPPSFPSACAAAMQQLHQGGLLPLVKLALNVFLQLVAHLTILALMAAVHPGHHELCRFSPQIWQQGPGNVAVVGETGVGQDGGGGEARQCPSGPPAGGCFRLVAWTAGSGPSTLTILAAVEAPRMRERLGVMKDMWDSTYL